MTLLFCFRAARSADLDRPQKYTEIPLVCKQNSHFTNDAVHSCGLLSFKFRSQYNRIPENCQPSFTIFCRKFQIHWFFSYFWGKPFFGLQRMVSPSILYYSACRLVSRFSRFSFPPALPLFLRASCATASCRPRCRDGSWWPNRPGPARPAWEPWRCALCFRTRYG